VIIQETIQYVMDTQKNLLASERIERLVIGVFFTAVQLSGGACGLAKSELTGKSTYAVGYGRHKGEFAPGQLKGRSILDVLLRVDDHPFSDSIRLAVLNAVSTQMIAQGGYTVERGRDPIEWVDASAGKRVTLVGAFSSYMDKLSETLCTLRVLELDVDAFPERHRHLYVPAERAAEILPDSDTVVLTGSTLVNRTLDDLLALLPPRAFTIMVGPSVGLFPNVLFRRGIRLIGTIRVLDPDIMFLMVSEGGAGYHLFGTCAEKICIVNEKHN
jgi:uncharacterized protein (DUF4213/DUF364 family)